MRVERRGFAQNRIEFRQVAELELLDHVEREVPRQHDLHLAGQGFRVGGRAVGIERLVHLGPQERVLASVVENARFRLVAGRHDVDADGGKRGDQDGRPHDPGFAPPQRAREAPQIEVAIIRDCFGCHSHHRRYSNSTCGTQGTPVPGATISVPELADILVPGSRFQSLVRGPGAEFPDTGSDPRFRRYLLSLCYNYGCRAVNHVAAMSPPGSRH